jgi:predicted nucleotidyltransferase
VITPAEAMRRLQNAAESGELDVFCRRHAVRVLTVFGSAGRGEEHPRDLDVGILVEPDAEFDVVAAITDLVELAGTDAVDLAHLNRGGPVICERALVGSVALYESEPGALAEAQVVAIAERIETDPMRRLNLRLLAERHPDR